MYKKRLSPRIVSIATVIIVIMFWSSVGLYLPEIGDFFIRPAFGQDNFENYVIGSGGQWQCIPKYVSPRCPGKGERLTELEEAVRTVFGKCFEMVKGKPIQNQAMLGISLILLPVGYYTGGAFPAHLFKAVWSDMPYDITECVVNGFNDLSLEHPDKKEAFSNFIKRLNIIRDTAFDVKGVVTGEIFEYEKLSKKFSDGFNLFKVGEKEAFLVRAWESYEMGWHAKEINEIKEFGRSVGELFYVPSADAAKNIQEADRDSSECVFTMVEFKLNQAKQAMRKFCEWEGYYYRNLERWVECYYEYHATAINWKDTPQADKFHEGRRLLGIQRNHIIRNLDLFKDIDKIEKRQQTYAILKSQDVLADNLAEAGLNQEDLVKVCRSIVALQSIKQKALEAGLYCPEKIVPKLNMFNSYGQILLHKKVSEVEDLLKRAEKGLSDCNLDLAASDLRAARENILHLVGPSKNGCIPTRWASLLSERCQLLEKRVPMAKKTCEQKTDLTARVPQKEELSVTEVEAFKKEIGDTYYQKWKDEWCIHRPQRKKGRVNWSGCFEYPLNHLLVLQRTAGEARTRAKQAVVRKLAACVDGCIMRDTTQQVLDQCIRDCRNQNPMPK